LGRDALKCFNCPHGDLVLIGVVVLWKTCKNITERGEQHAGEPPDCEISIPTLPTSTILSHASMLMTDMHKYTCMDMLQNPVLQFDLLAYHYIPR